jgi:hypothetical protein
MLLFSAVYGTMVYSLLVTLYIYDIPPYDLQGNQTCLLNHLYTECPCPRIMGGCEFP